MAGATRQASRVAKGKQKMRDWTSVGDRAPVHADAADGDTLQPQDGVEAWVQANWAQAPETFHLTVEGASIACRGWNLDAADLPGIVLVHGFRAHAEWWDHIAPALTARHRVVAFSMSGMGDSGWREAYSRRQWGREALVVATALRFTPTTIIAHSFGVMGCLLAAKDSPDQVRRLIVIDSGIPDLDAGDHRIPTSYGRTYPDAETAIDRFRLVPPGRWPHPSILAYIAHTSVVELEDGWTWKFDPRLAASLNEEVYIDSMVGVPVPVDVIRGEHSEVMQGGHVGRLRRFCEDMGDEIVIPASHHHIPIEQPASLTAALLGLLANERRYAPERAGRR